MTDLWDDDGFGGGGPVAEEADDDWDEGEESLDTSLEDGFDDPTADNDEAWADDD